MKVGIYSPYLDTGGGGEKYMLSIAECLVGNQVDIFLDNHLWDLGVDRIIDNLKLHEFDLSKINFIKAPFGQGSSSIKRLKFLKAYDLIFYLTDGSIFYSTAKKNVLHIQSPIVTKKNLKDRINLSSWDLIIYNSNFTRDHCQTNWPIKSKVVYPPVDIKKIKPLKKEKMILNVGFFSPSRNKKQSELIKAFKKLIDSGVEGWTLKLVGGVESHDLGFIEKLKKESAGYRVEFYPNLAVAKLYKLYGQATFYWHGAGYGETDPTKMEHFGISSVEAMAGGAVPLVINKGGQPEIVTEGSGVTWDDLSELASKTVNLINNQKLITQMSKKAVERSREFSKEKFIEEIRKIAYG